MLAVCVSQNLVGQENRSPTVGAPGFVDQIKLPGSELAAKPVSDDRVPIVVRIVKTFPHGDHFRYDIAFQGLEPGEYNLADYLVRKDGSSTEDLPEIKVEIRSLLPPGQIEPNQLENSILPRLGGYKSLMVIAIVFWSIVFAGLILLGWKRKETAPIIETKKSFADLLRPRLEQAMRGELHHTQLAELERMLIAFWRRRLDLEGVAIESAIEKIKANPEAGPTVLQLEKWIHSPHAQSDVSLQQLLAPYESIPSELLSMEESEVVGG